MKNIYWQKTVTREFSYLWASYTAEVYKTMEKMTGTTLKYNLFFLQDRILTIYRNPSDVLRSYKLINSLVSRDPKKAQENMDKFESYYDKGRVLIAKIKKIKQSDRNQIIELLLQLDRNYLKVISYYLFVVFLGYAGDYASNKKFIKLHQKQFKRIRMCSMDAEFHSVLPVALSMYDKRLKKIALYMSRLELTSFIKGKKVDWIKIKNRKKKACLLVKNNQGRDYPFKKIDWVLARELPNLHKDKHDKILKGIIVYRGKVKGSVVKVVSTVDYKKIKKGCILVIPMTKPDIMPYLKKVKGIVTNDGGALSHVSIIARELKIPCVAGTVYATDTLRDGDKVLLDANAGTVKKIE